jgi:pyruvate dehydrogenase E2 component (dihydrolipoamide acetyltransferase)
MASKIIMPQGGQDITEGTIVGWLKKEGENVKQGEVICEVETEKAVFEVQAPADGILVRILAQDGDRVPIFSVIGIIADPGEKVDIERVLAEQKREDREIDVSRIRERLGQPGEEKARRVRASGRAKRLAEERGIDLSLIEGTGPQGRITEKDVLGYAGRDTAKAETLEPMETPAETRRGRAVPMSRMRSVVARRMQQSKQTIPHFYVTVTVDMTEAIRFRDVVNSRPDSREDGKISVNDMITKAAALALEEFYQVNCTLHNGHILYLKEINIGVAVGLDEGLIVPVVEGADTLSLRDIARRTKEVVGLSKAGKQASLTPGTFTITNMGMFDVENFIAIINPPESAILSVGTTERQVVVGDDDSLRIRDVMKMTLSIDHRLVDGVMAAKFVNKIKYHLQNPKTLQG